VTRQYLSNVDSTMLHLEDPNNRMVMTAVMVFNSPIDFERLKATIQVRLLSISRFRQRLAWSRLGVGNPYWEDDPELDINYHVQRATLPPPGDQAALQDVVSFLASTPLDHTRPLWQFHLIENYEQCCALVMRIHHCIGDGMAAVHVILSLTDSEPDVPWPVVQPQSLEWQGRAPGAVFRAARSSTKRRRQTAQKLVQEGFDLIAEPSRLRDLGTTGKDAAADLARFLLLTPDPETVLRGALGEKKRAAWSLGIPLKEVKTVRRHLGGTLNDVLLTVVTGALRRYLQRHGEPVDALTMRAVVPVNVRPPDKDAELGNYVGAVFLSLPVAISDPLCRLNELKRRMHTRKESYEAPVFGFLLGVLGPTPAKIAHTLVNTFSSRATAVMTNVKGPQDLLYLAGSPLVALLPWAPPTGRMGVAVSILSYAGHVQVGVLTDEGLVPDPETIVAAFHDEFEELLAQARAAGASSSRQRVRAPAPWDDSAATQDSEPNDGVATNPEKAPEDSQAQR
jgi:diacylglycerol O-acyltransferase